MNQGDGLASILSGKKASYLEANPETGLNIPKAVTQVSYGAQVQDTGTEI